MEKVSLPIKTKIVAWWMIIVGIVVVISNLPLLSFSPPILYFGGTKIANLSFPPFILHLFPAFYGPLFAGIIFLILGILFLKKKKLAWWATLTVCVSFILINLWMIIESALYSETFYRFYLNLSNPHLFSNWSRFLSLFPAPLILLILLVLDRKNFWKIAT